MCRATEEKKAFLIFTFFLCLTASQHTAPRSNFEFFCPYFLCFLFKRCLIPLPFSTHVLWRFLSIWKSFFFINENLESPSSYLHTLISPSKRGRNRQPTHTQMKKPHAVPAMQLLPLSLPPASTALYNGSFFRCLVSVISPPPPVLFCFPTIEAKWYNK